MKTRLQNNESNEEIFARFARHREQSDAQMSGKMAWVGSLLVLLVFATASFNAHAQLPNPGMQIDPARTAVCTTEEATRAIRSSR